MQIINERYESWTCEECTIVFKAYPDVKNHISQTQHKKFKHEKVEYVTIWKK